MSQLNKREEIWMAALTAAIAAKMDAIPLADKCLAGFDKNFPIPIGASLLSPELNTEETKILEYLTKKDKDIYRNYIEYSEKLYKWMCEAEDTKFIEFFAKHGLDVL